MNDYRQDQEKRLVVNGFNSTNGGGLRIFLGLVNFLCEEWRLHFEVHPIIYFSPIHDKTAVRLARSAGIDARVFQITGLKLVDQVLLYFLYFPIRLNLHQKKECIVNFGDFIVPFTKNQIYYFDWLYAAVDAPTIWGAMPWRSRLGRTIKRFFIEVFIHTPNIMVVQSKFVSDQVAEVLGRANTTVLKCPVELPRKLGDDASPEALMQNDQSLVLLCLSSLATHKNVEILLDVADILKSRGKSVTIMLTLDESDTAVRRFLSRVETLALSDRIVNLGVLDFQQVNDWIYKSDALLLPTKLESFGLPYVESLCRGTPILTSDTAFAREICTTGTLFFDPNDAANIADTIERFIINGGCGIDSNAAQKLMEQCRPHTVYTTILKLARSL